MNCSDFQQQLAGYVLGALEPDEMLEMARHLAETTIHQGCAEALMRAEFTAAQLGLSLAPLAPGERVWAGIERGIGKKITAPRTAKWREALAWSLAAAASATLIIVNDQRAQQSQRATRSEQLLANASASGAAAALERDRCRKELESMHDARASLLRDAMALLENPATRVIALAPVPGKAYHASAIVNLAERRTIIVASALPAVADKDFELWVIRGKEPPVAAGLMHTGAGGTALGEVDPRALAGAPPNAFAVSLEPLGGREAPTEVLMAGALSG